MSTHIQSSTGMRTLEGRMSGVFKKTGAMPVDGLSAIAKIGWAQIFMSIDRPRRGEKGSLRR